MAENFLNKQLPKVYNQKLTYIKMAGVFTVGNPLFDKKLKDAVKPVGIELCLQDRIVEIKKNVHVFLKQKTSVKSSKTPEKKRANDKALLS